LGKQDSIYENKEEIPTDIVSSSRSSRVFDKFYNCEDVYVRLRITLHIFFYTTIDEEGKVKMHIYSPVTLDEIIEDIEYAERIYEDMNLKFKITSVSAIMREIDSSNDEDFAYELARMVMFNDYQDNFKFLQEASNNPDSISVFYALSIWNGVSGLSIFPWDNDPYGIQIVRKSSGIYVLSHEIGHYLGLYHTFQDPSDYVEDTPYGEITMDEIGTPEDPNQYNIMSYPKGGIIGLFLTHDQIARVKTFLTISRDTHVILEEDDDFSLLGIVSTNRERADFLFWCRDMLIQQLSPLKNNDIEGEEIPVETEDVSDAEFNPILDEKCKKCCEH
jgi:hypothetical protein